jgi:hypothetical protein
MRGHPQGQVPRNAQVPAWEDNPGVTPVRGGIVAVAQLKTGRPECEPDSAGQAGMGFRWRWDGCGSVINTDRGSRRWLCVRNDLPERIMG